MRRSSVITLSGVLAVLGAISRANGALSNTGCLCTSDQPCWPTADVFSQLESKLSQPLVYPLPSAYSCYPPSNPAGNCTDVTANTLNGHWHSSRPGSLVYHNFEAYMFPNGTLDACFMNTSISGTCGQGRVPVIGVDARSVADVKAAVEFAVEHSLKLVVKNTGHDFVGRSSGRNTFMVWTHNLNAITYDPVFMPKGAPENETFQAMTLGAGVEWQDAYAAANGYGRFIVGGGAPSVGAAGGWLLGGGHSPFSPTYGLGVDNALEISVVLSTGDYVVANKYQNSDLFWALRGGGGGTYGIVTSVTYLTHPTPPVQVWTFNANATDSALQELVDGYLRYQTKFTDDGWGGYGGVSDQGMQFTYYAPNMANETVAAMQQDWLNFVQSLASDGVVFTSSTSFYSSWYIPFQQFLLLGGAHDSVYEFQSSRFLSRNTVASVPSQVVQLLIDCNAGILTVAGGKVNQIDVDSAGVNPAWRDTVVETTCSFIWDETMSLTEVQETIQGYQEWIKAMYYATPNEGSYLNEASPFEVDWQTSFFGAHYSTLKSIKDKYDPNRLFVVKEGVGSDEWNDDLTCRN